MNECRPKSPDSNVFCVSWHHSSDRCARTCVVTIPKLLNFPLHPYLSDAKTRVRAKHFFKIYLPNFCTASTYEVDMETTQKKKIKKTTATTVKENNKKLNMWLKAPKETTSDN